MDCDCYCYVALPHGAMVWSAMCDHAHILCHFSLVLQSPPCILGCMCVALFICVLVSCLTVAEAKAKICLVNHIYHHPPPQHKHTQWLRLPSILMWLVVVFIIASILLVRGWLCLVLIS